ncbi:MAG TPA: DUF3822 family protein [Bacteroidales bacterium]|jgi:hypothetical protein|nr:DUF3822 family protein [Bacteroidales bacterium]HPE41069.1 DUF3822 family protein [Bacteroidales bacterium]
MLHNIFQDTIKTIRLDSNGFSHYYEGTFFDFSQLYHQEILIVIANQPPVAIPMEIYQKDKQTDYLKIQYDLTEMGQIVTTDFKDYVLLNYIPTEETAILEKITTPIHFIPLFLYQMAHLFPIPEMLFLLDVKEHHMNCALLKHEELQFITYFSLTEDTDCLYHVMNICTQYKIDPSEIDLYYSSLPDSLIHLLKSYFTISHLEKPLFNQNLL